MNKRMTEIDHVLLVGLKLTIILERRFGILQENLQ